MYQVKPIAPQEKRALLAEFSQSCEQGDLSWSFPLKENGPCPPERRMTLYFQALPGVILRLTRLAALLGMPEAAIRAWRAALPGADAVFLTVSQDLSSLRLYCQHLSAALPRVEAQDLRPFDIYRGFKALPGGHLREDRYLCHPLRPLEETLPPLRETLAAAGLEAAQIAALCAGLSPGRMIHAAISGAGRQSWLMTLREAGVPPALSAALFAPLVPLAPELAPLLRARALLHLAGGADPLKGRFMTLYLEADAADRAAFLAETPLTAPR